MILAMATDASMPETAVLPAVWLGAVLWTRPPAPVWSDAQ